jgi:hypothetical protein
MSKKAPLCQIIKPAPWQSKPSDTSEGLYWRQDEFQTPISEVSETIAKEEAPTKEIDTRLPMPQIEED